MMHGQGTYTRYYDHCDGTVKDVYEGQWENGKKHGHGKSTDEDTYVYEGQWENGEKHGQGQGTCYYDGKVIYDGQWENGKKHGYVVGDKVLVLDQFISKKTNMLQTKWRKASVLQEDGGKVEIHFDGWSDTWNFWLDLNVPEDRKRLQNSD